jgi:hypothetical protein
LHLLESRFKRPSLGPYSDICCFTEQLPEYKTVYRVTGVVDEMTVSRDFDNEDAAKDFVSAKPVDNAVITKVEIEKDEN